MSVKTAYSFFFFFSIKILLYKHFCLSTNLYNEILLYFPFYVKIRGKIYNIIIILKIITAILK